MQIIVLGMHRSGTSAVTGLLASMGAYFGPDGIAMRTRAENPRGYWERTDVVSANDALLAGAGAAWNMPQRYDREKIPRALLDALVPRMRAISAELSAHPISIIKDPRLCLTLNEWKPHFSRPVCLIIHRNPLAIAHSLHARGDCSVATGLAMWEAYVRAALHASRGVPRFTLDYDRMLADPASELTKLLDALSAPGTRDGLRVPDQAAVSQLIQPSLRHHLASREELAAFAAPAQVRLFDQLAAGDLAAVPDEPVSVASQDALRYFADHERVLQIALQDALLERDVFDRSSSRAISGMQTKADRVLTHRDELRKTISEMMAGAEGGRLVLQDMTARPELRAAFWLSRFVRRKGVTIADVNATADRLAAVWSAGRDALGNSVAGRPQ